MPPSGVGLAMPPSFSLSGPFPSNHISTHDDKYGDSLMGWKTSLDLSTGVGDAYFLKRSRRKLKLEKLYNLSIFCSELHVVRHESTTGHD
eukprot:6843062-Karenia_brevis.AAC.1